MALDGGSIKEANGRSQWFLSLPLLAGYAFSDSLASAY